MDPGVPAAVPAAPGSVLGSGREVLSSSTDFRTPDVTVTFPVTCACSWSLLGTHSDNFVWAVGEG